MIKPSDFRIGNYVKGSLIFDDSGEETGEQEIAMIVDISAKGGYYWTDDLHADPATCGYNGGYSIGEDDCIPLTEEFLQKFGLEENEIFTKRGLRVYHSADIDIEFDIKANSFQLVVMGHDDFISVGENIIYVHQLQNLYFALTGKELPYTP